MVLVVILLDLRGADSNTTGAASVTLLDLMAEGRGGRRGASYSAAGRIMFD
jgi:hypothetical protein